MASEPIISTDYWKNLQISKHDLEYLHTHLFEMETPLTTRELVGVLIHERYRAESLAVQQRRQSGGKIYFPKESYRSGDSLVFPAMDWKHGEVSDSRPGTNPSLGEFDVLTVQMEDGTERLFASGLAAHSLNNEPVSDEEAEYDSAAILRSHGHAIDKKLETTLKDDENIVRIAGRWFPRALLIDVNVGNLNLAEAVLDMSGGEPLPTSALLKDVSLPEGVNPKLAEFSLNLALQEDERFDEVGPAGEVLWCLHRLEPEGVRDIPFYLMYSELDYDRTVLTEELINLEKLLDDELSDIEINEETEPEVVTIPLIYPHLRAGTLPLSNRVQSLFPTAYEAPRVRFTLVDGKTEKRFPGWVVREHKYVYGLLDFYKDNELMPGSLVSVRKGEIPGEVIIEAKNYRSTKDWLRTAIIGTDGIVVFAMLKQAVSAEFNERMAIATPAFETVDQAWSQMAKRPLDQLVVSMIREMSKLTPQGHVHAQELYSALNIVRRIPPAPLFAMLETKPEISHVGDLHYKLSE
ncbi:MAG TPA: hypothetical protein DCX53_10635 [Anaerolineae bacterium]|nr:hypothetical protein [Anaerolineae bacterium]